MEASALPASVGLARARLGIGAPLLRLRSDEQLVSLFRAGNEDAFRVIHDRYRARMLAYTRQMLGATAADPEDAVQEIFVRAYAGLRANRRDLALRAWLYRIAHNRCVDELRRPYAVAVRAVDELGESSTGDPQARVEQREALRRLIADVQRLPEQQRSALLMRELGGMPYGDLAGALGVSVPAVKSLLVRARVGLVQASEARDTACASIRQDLIVAHDRGVRASGRARRHMRDCSHCRSFRGEVQGVSRGLGMLLPALGPLGVLAKLAPLHGLSFGLGSGGGAAAGSGTGAAAAGSGAAAGSTATVASTTVAAGASAGSAAVAGGGALAAAGAGHVVTIIAATAIAAGGAIGIQHEVATGTPHHHHHRAAAITAAAIPSAGSPAATDARGTTPAGAPSVPGTAPPASRALTVASAASVARAVTPGVMHATGSAAHAGGGPHQSPGAELHAPNEGFPVTTTTVTTSDPVTTTPTTPTTPTSTGTTTTTTAGTTTPTTPVITTTDPTSTVPATTPISGSGTTTPVSTNGNPGTATGIVPTVAPASTWGATRHRLHTWHFARRGAAAASATDLPTH